MDLLILQNHGELRVAQKVLGNSFKNAKIIAWLPFAIDDLRKENISYTTIADYVDQKYDPYRHIPWVKQYKEWCCRLDEHISLLAPEIASIKMRPFLNKLHAFRIVFNLYFYETEKLFIIFKKEDASHVYYFHYPETQLNLLSRLFDIVQKDNKWGINFIGLKLEHDCKSLFPDKCLVPDWFDRKSIFYKIARYIMKRPIHKTINSFLSGVIGYPLFKTKPTILVLNSDENIDDVLREIKQKIDCNYIFWEDVLVNGFNPIAIDVEKIINAIRNDLFTHKWTTIHEMDLFDLFLPEIMRTLSNDISLLISTIKKFRKLNDKFNFSLIISGYAETPCQAIYDQCEDMNIPVVHFLHGNTLGLMKGFPDIALCTRGRKIPSNLFYLIYSNYIKEFCNDLNKHFPNYTAQEVSVGSIYIERLERKGANVKSAKDNYIKICYVCGAMGLYFTDFKGGSYDDATLYDLRNKIIDKFKNKSNITVFYKMGYNTEHYGLKLEKEIIKGSWNNIKAIPSNKRLVDLLEVADIILLEMPTTPLFEVLITNKPIVVLIDPRALVLTDEAERLIKNRVTIVRSREEMERCVDDIVENGENAAAFTRPNHNDKTFINTYATCGDFNSKNRTIDFLKTLLYKRRKTQSI